MAISTLLLDLETKSDVDLTKSGVYRYADSPYFDILLFAYSVDDSPVKVIDLASGESLPDDILHALTDDSVTKHSFNASFERVCLYDSEHGVRHPRQSGRSHQDRRLHASDRTERLRRAA